jgi:hypothetical protein
MGWWKIRDIETGQIDFQAKTFAPGTLVNAIPGKEDIDQLFNGDEPADIMGDTLREISKVYEKEWNRPAKKEELTACFNFCCNGMFRNNE